MVYLYALAVTVAFGSGYFLGQVDTRVDPKLDACAREHNVYACEYVAQPKVSNLLPPPEGEDK